MKSLLLPLATFILSVLTSQAQGYHLYHLIGPAMFTNSTSFGYADGQLAGADYRCGVYAGTDVDFMQPVFIQNLSTLTSLFSSSGTVALTGSFTLAATTNVWVQFRAWPAICPTYETAIVNQPPAPVGLSDLYPAIPSNVIIEFPIQVGPLWLQMIPEPSPCSLCAMGLLLGFTSAVARRQR